MCYRINQYIKQSIEKLIAELKKIRNDRLVEKMKFYKLNKFFIAFIKNMQLLKKKSKKFFS